MKKIKALLILLIMSALLVACGGNDEGDNNEEDAQGNDAEDKGVITIGNAPYDYETPPVEITKLIAEEQGYEVEVLEGDIGFMFLSMQQGDVDIWPGLWPNIHETYYEKFAGDFQEGSTIFDGAPTGWVAPTYMGIESIDELVGNEDIVDGKLIGFEPGSGMMLTSEEVVEAHGLDLEIVSGTMSSMLTEVEYAISQQEPILFLGWRPHTMFRKYDIVALEDSKGYWGDDSFVWGVNNDFESKAPEIYNFVNNFEMSIDEVEEYLYQNQDEGQDATELAKQWIEDNRSDIDAWLE
ncbi:glycine betaine ABC transporter substrate-binding protein [Ornithinibacillus halophilus]|uniref:Glycine betaine/proline transport system substrate-binding protein n=1 Tax=Ornithinibacillus halophilus TaxID=930117 RepID=A0A1M5L1L7_9BACI|nr:glycine betaine ABC transporter substrate-binding protein [Ornithinibacillus halophilus]SHG59012.1 glycine betaine/proline transport system substrate-binding protein [Ornithinibacillus halophilus]